MLQGILIGSNHSLAVWYDGAVGVVDEVWTGEIPGKRIALSFVRIEALVPSHFETAIELRPQ